MPGQARRLAASDPGHVVSHAGRRLPLGVRAARAIGILTIPSIAVALTLFAAWQLRHEPFVWLDPLLTPGVAPSLRASAWLSWGHAVVCVVFLISNLVNRRYGEDYALAHVLASWALASVLAIAILANVIVISPPVTEVPGLRVAAGFMVSMFLGQLAGVYVFDRTRGVAWWNAPAYSALASAFVAMPLFYLLAFAGTHPGWLNLMIVDLGLKALMGFALLVPYVLLRQVIRPLQGLGGY
jgi:uncharacterized PurR-regulated membrane protein YhhQ (DUF165 family)